MNFYRLITSWPLAMAGLTPLSCNIKVTERCNLRCRMCSIWRRGNRITELDVRDWNRIARILKRWHVGRVVLTGGEPFIRKDLPELVRSFAQYGFSLTLLTNGTIPDRQRLATVIKAGVHDIGISLDSLDASTQSAIAGRPQITPKIMATIEHALDLVPGIVEVMITAGQVNLREIPNLVRRMDAMGAFSIINPVNVALPGTGETWLAVKSSIGLTDRIDSILVDEVYDQLLTMKRAGIRILNSTKFLNTSRIYLKTGRYSWNCDAGDRYFTIFSDGSLAGCSDLPPFRNLAREYGRTHTSKMKTYYQLQRSKCSGCIYSCWRELSYLLYDPKTIVERALDSARMISQRWIGR